MRHPHKISSQIWSHTLGLNQNLDFSHKNIINALARVQDIIDNGMPLKILEKLSKFTN